MRPGGADRGVQPAVDPSSARVAVPDQWLAEFEGTEEAKNLNRVIGDALLVGTLTETGFSGAAYEMFERELIKYGLGVMIGWSIRGVVLDKCKSRGYGGLPQPLEGTFTREAIVDIATETVARAAVHFRDDVLLRGVWDPRKGASIKTFFVGQCLIRFPNVYRSWHREQFSLVNTEPPWWNVDSLERLAQLAGNEPEAASRINHSNDPERRAIERATLEEALEGVRDPRLRTALVLRENGHRHDEIAEHLGVTRKTVERMFANHVERQRRGTGR